MVSTLAGTNVRDVLLVDAQEQQQAEQLTKAVKLTSPGMRFAAEASAGATVRVPPHLSAMIARVVEAVAAGHTVTISSMPEKLTTTAAAKLLGISRPTLMRMVEDERIEAHKVGTHTRLRTVDVLAERDARRQRQLQAFQELRELEED